MTEPNQRIRSLLERVGQRFGGPVANVYRTLSRHTGALAGFVPLEEALREHGRLAAAERALVALEVAVANRCDYGEGAFEVEARACGIDEATIARISEGGLPDDPRRRPLVESTRRVMATRGHLGRAEATLLPDRGIDEATLMAITTLIAADTLATYANHLAGTRIDPAFR
jgi:alkylhydroperoxidase family enzyme